MYKYKLNLKEQDTDRVAFQEKRIAAFKEIESRLNALYPMVDKAKDETIAYYQEKPESYSVIVPTVDLGLLDVVFCSIAITGERPSILSTSGLSMFPRN